MAKRGRLQQVGIRAARLQGAGREFESLREYMPDDEMRRIDWKASARSGKLVARQYEVEKSQSVILDRCGPNDARRDRRHSEAGLRH